MTETGKGARASTWDVRTEELLRDWLRRAAAAERAHYTRVTQLRRQNVFLGVPAVVFSAIVGTSLFATLTEENLNRSLRIAVGATSVAAAVFSAMNAFFRFGERAERHVIAADWYAAVRRGIEQLLALDPAEREPTKVALEKIRKEMSRVGQQSPEIGQRLWEKVARDLRVTDYVDLTRVAAAGPAGEAAGAESHSAPDDSTASRRARPLVAGPRQSGPATRSGRTTR